MDSLIKFSNAISGPIAVMDFILAGVHLILGDLFWSIGFVILGAITSYFFIERIKREAREEALGINSEVA